MSENKQVITGVQLKHMLLGAYRSFEKNYQAINELNVFPVPDGDTGTNMMHTMSSVAKALSGLKDSADVGEVGSAAAKSAIMGARGNSGVILSQLLRGIGKGVAGKITIDNNELGKAFQYGILYAYRSVAKPVEGTILTVARGVAKGAYSAVRHCTSIENTLEEAIKVGKAELAKTPDQLPALKAAGVVDAGGQGLIVFLEGCLAGLRNEDCAELEIISGAIAAGKEEPVDLEYPYCTEFIVKGAAVESAAVRSALQDLGNSMIVAVIEDIVKVHIHTNVPGSVLNIAQQWGSLHDIKIDNMADQHNNKIFEDIKPEKEKHGLGIVAVAAGEGLGEIMRHMGAAEIISGGQSMNPSVESFVKAIEEGSCEQYIILPNNKNIILAAEQVKKLLGEAKVSFVPTTNLAQGLAALLGFDSTKSMAENTAKMTQRSKEVTSGAVTLAVRDSVVNGIEVAKGDYLGILNDKIVCKGQMIEEVLEQMLAEGDYELLSLYYGSDLSKEQAENIVCYLETVNEDWEIELFCGGQPLYPLLMAME